MSWGYGVDLDPVEAAIRDLREDQRSDQEATREILEQLLTEIQEEGKHGSRASDPVVA